MILYKRYFQFLIKLCAPLFCVVLFLFVMFYVSSHPTKQTHNFDVKDVIYAKDRVGNCYACMNCNSSKPHNIIYVPSCPTESP